MNAIDGVSAPNPLPARELYGNKDLSRLLRPHSIAVVGASATPGSFGHRTLENISIGYIGKIYPINPKYPVLMGHKCYPSIDDLPDVPDCVVVAVAAEQVLPIVEKCAAMGVGGTVIYSSGFLETGDAKTTELQHRMVEIARQSGMHILGPNTVGAINFVEGTGITFMQGTAELPRRAGSIGLAVQSGALGFTIVQGMHRGIGLSFSITPGNSADIDICDLINFLVEDKSTKAIACCFEGVADGERFLEAGRRALAAGKPVIAYKMARNDLSSAAAQSHTGTLTGSNAAYDAAFERTGVIVVNDFEALLETAAFFTKAGEPKAPGVGVMSGSGGAAIMAADKADEAGVPLPPLAPQTEGRLRQRMPGFGSAANPCDITAASIRDHTMYGDCIQAFADDPSFAAVVVPMLSVSPPSTVDRASYLVELAKGLGKPLCVVWLNEWYSGPGADIYDSSDSVATFRSMRRCMETLKSWLVYHQRREALIARSVPKLADEAAAARARDLLSGWPAGEALTEGASKALLASYGISVTKERLVQREDEAAQAAAEIGYPVVLKAESADIPHKTEAGVVHLALTDEAAVRRAYRAIVDKVAALPGPPVLAGVSVQEMVRGGIEMMAGVTNDRQFGPLIVCGMGGVAVEVLRDTASALAPVSKNEALAMLRSLRSYGLLAGYRGSKPVVLDALAEAIARISQLGADQRDLIGELDVNPIMASPDRIVALDALAVISGREAGH